MRLVAACLLLLLGACSERGSGDAVPSETEAAAIEAEGPRIAVLSPALGLTLVELGLEDRIVGRHAWDTVTPKDVPSVGDQSAIEYETLIAVDPTHVLMEWGERELPAKLVELSASRGWDLTNYRTLRLEDIVRTTRGIAELFEVETTLPERMEEAWKQRDARAGEGGVLLLIQMRPEPAALGPGSAHHEILTRLGYAAALRDGGPYQVLLGEDVVQFSPARVVVILPAAGPDDVAADRAVLERLLPESRVDFLTEPTDLMSGPNLLGFTERLDAVLSRPTAESGE